MIDDYLTYYRNTEGRVQAGALSRENKARGLEMWFSIDWYGSAPCCSRDPRRREWSG
jgi:hypothetical protein